ncbi:hypothetical protein MHU86_15056 [Fragilaria crotonensis]|nr:hypothetical protein MHU86_15056 [Fragilaria crotonensis]
MTRTTTPSRIEPTLPPPPPQNARPGRAYSHAIEIDMESHYGKSHTQKSDTDIRIFFQNVKGLTYSASGEDYDYYVTSTRSLDADIVGMAETNTAWTHPHLQSLFQSRARQHMNSVKVSFSSPTQTIDPIPEKETFQSGGTVTFSAGTLVPMVHGNDIKDPSGLGRWSGHTLRGKDNKHLSIITAYRVCTGSIQTSHIGSAFNREYEHHRSSGICSPSPRKIILQDLKHTIIQLQTTGNSILLMLDSNSLIEEDRDLQEMIASCDLHDLHHTHPAPSTYLGSSRRRIDHMLGCSNVAHSMTGSGSLSYLEGPQSDHRGLFVDINHRSILGVLKATPAIQSATSRILKSGNPATVELYQKAMRSYYKDHNMVDRMQNIFTNADQMATPDLRHALEKWDQDQGRAMRHAEASLSKPPKPYAWSPTLRNAGIVYRYWRLRLSATKHNLDYSTTFDRMETLVRQHDSTFELPLRKLAHLQSQEVQTHLNSAQKHLRECQRRAGDIRFKSYLDLLATYVNDGDTHTQKDSLRKAKIVQNTIKSERTKVMYANIRRVVKPEQHGGLNRVLVPRHRRHTESNAELPADYQHFLATTDPEDIIWDTLLDKASIEENLLRYNRNSFRAASASPCGAGDIHQLLTFNSLSKAASEVLSGSLPRSWQGKDALLREFLTSFALPDSVKQTASISTEVKEDDVKYGFGKWKESTSTSPSGRHLGHYKAIVRDECLLKCMTQFLHVVINRGITMTRWCNAVSIMIEKDAGVPKITRLRIIHLFEADFNFFLKLIWGSRLVKRAVQLDLLNNGQHGSVPKRTAMDPIMLTQLTTDLCRILKHNHARFDNDASACYDRIIVTLGMLAARRCGMPENAVRSHADSLRLMKYTVKTAHGISEDNYRGTAFSPLFGTGQGSGASPSVWLTLVVVLMNTLDRMIPERMEFLSPDSQMSHSRLIDAFVDDTSLGFTDPGMISLETMIAKLKHMAQTWENLLFYSGGALNLTKCSWHIMFWDWKKGRPGTRQLHTDDSTLSLTTQGNTTDPTLIRRLPLHQASRLLGVHLTPTGNFSHQLQVLKTKADTFAIRLRSPKLTPRDIMTFHRTMYTPAMTYVLPALATDEEELAPIQSKIMPAILQKLGYSSKLPTAIRHGPEELGGLALLDLRTELGISNIKYMRNAIYSASEPGKLMLLNIKYSQIEAGIQEPILEHPSICIPYLTKTWITSVRQYLFQHNMQISLTDTLQVHLRSKHDQCVMNPDNLTRYTTTQQTDINLVRLYLQVITLSDLSTTDGNNIDEFFLRGERKPHQRIRKKTWPRQETPTTSQQKMWRKYITSNYIRYATKWRDPLGSFTVEHPQPGQTHHLPNPTNVDSTLPEYIQSLPRWYRRLLYDYRQVATDLAVWRAFRARQRLIIASDGSLNDTAGTFGWKITTNKHEPLFEGSGPVDGPIEIGSSTRSELGGFTAPLLLVTVLARHWGLRHRCTFRWIADSKVAINRVTLVTRKDHRPTSQPDNADYLSLIKDLFKELRRPLHAQWIKSHQDSQKQYEQLSADAKLNVDVDNLATAFHKRKRANPSRSTDHLPASAISIVINKTRFYGNIDANIRYHINGSYLKDYLQIRHHWSEFVWNLIDLRAFGRHFKTITLAHRPAHLKFVHNQLPLGDKKYRCSVVKDPKLKVCPCCLLDDEDQTHFIQCQQNTAWAQALAALTKTILKDPHPSRPAYAACLESFLRNPHQPVNPELPNFPPHMREQLDLAIQTQNLIGWMPALQGFLSTHWHTLAAMSLSDHDKLENKAGISRTHKALTATATFTRSIWLGRNDTLHKQKETEDSLVYSTESAEIRHYHSHPQNLPASDRHYCSTPLSTLIRSRPSTRRRWLQRVRKARAMLLKHGSYQRSITQYITRTHVSPPTQHENAPQRDHCQVPAHRGQTTQQRMTSFYPGRPPDPLITPPENPSLPS